MHAVPFTAENCPGYTQEEMDALNAEFTARWNGWTVPETQLFFYDNGAHMTEEDAMNVFQKEVAGR
jgi:hypothetical protein